MLRIIAFVILINTTLANHGIPWHIKLGYQNIDGGFSQSNEKVEGAIFSYENLFNRQVHSYFSTFTEFSYCSANTLSNSETRLFHYGVGIKWNFGPTDFDYEPAVDYEFVLNQGSFYLKAGLGYSIQKLEDPTQNSRLIKTENKDLSTQYGLGYELLGKKAGFFLEYMRPNSTIFNTGIMRAGVNWKF